MEPLNSSVESCPGLGGLQAAVPSSDSSPAEESSGDLNSAATSQVTDAVSTNGDRTSKARISLTRGKTFESPSRCSGTGDACSTVAPDCTTTHSEACPHPLESLHSTEFSATSSGLNLPVGDPTVPDSPCSMPPRGVLLLSKIAVSRDELLELLKFVPIEILMAESQETPTNAGRYPLCPIDLVCNRCPLPLLEEYCRRFLLRVSRFYLVLLSTTIAIRVVVATDVEGSRETCKCYTLALCRGIVGGAPYQLDGSWIGTPKRPSSDAKRECHVSIGMTMRLFAESLGKTCVKVPLHGVSNRAVNVPDLEEAFKGLFETDNSANEPNRNTPDTVSRTLADLEGRALALQYLRRFSVCLENLFHILPLLRGNPSPISSTTPAEESNPDDEGMEDDDDDEDDGCEHADDHKRRSIFENPAMLGEEISTFAEERDLRDRVRFLLKEMQTRLFEAAFISKQKAEHDIETVERSLKKVIECMEASASTGEASEKDEKGGTPTAAP